MHMHLELRINLHGFITDGIHSLLRRFSITCSLDQLFFWVEGILYNFLFTVNSKCYIDSYRYNSSTHILYTLKLLEFDAKHKVGKTLKQWFYIRYTLYVYA